MPDEIIVMFAKTAIKICLKRPGCEKASFMYIKTFEQDKRNFALLLIVKKPK